MTLTLQELLQRIAYNADDTYLIWKQLVVFETVDNLF